MTHERPVVCHATAYVSLLVFDSLDGFRLQPKKAES